MRTSRQLNHLQICIPRKRVRPFVGVMGFLLILVAALGAAPSDFPQDPAPAAEVAPAETTRARLDQAAALLRRNAAADALPLLQPLVEPGALDDPSLLMEAHHYIGLGYQQRNEYPLSLTHYGRALELSRTVNSARFEAMTLHYIAQVRKNQGDYAEALGIARQAIAIFDSLGDPSGAGRAWITIGAVHDLQGEYRTALEDYQRAKERLEASKSQAYFRLLNEIGITHENLGNFEEALAVYTQALAEQERTGDKYGQATTLGNMGSAYNLLGQDERALEHYQRSLALCRELGERRGQSFLLGNLAQIWQNLGEHERALDSLRQQAQLAHEIGNRLAEGLALKNQGDVLMSLDRVGDARAHYDEALAVYRAMGARARISSTVAAIAEVALREGRPADALRLGEEALALALETESPDLEWEARLVLARAARSSGNVEGALTHLRASIDLINGVRGRVLSDVGKVGYLERRQSVFHELVDALEVAGRPADALEAAEAARSRAFADLLAGRQVAFKAADATRLQEIREAEALLRVQARVAMAGPPAGAELLRKRAAVEADLGDRLRSLQSGQPELASLVVAEPLSASEITATARRLRSTIVEYFVTDRRLFIWVVSPAGQVRSAAVGLPREELRKKVRALQDTLDRVDLAALRDPRPVRALLSELYRWILAPVERDLPRDATELVYVVPHDALLLVPFAALVDERGRYTVERHTLASAPSVGLLRYTADKKRRVISPGQPHLLALADPSPPEAAGLGRLPGARTEVRGIGRTFPAQHRTVLVADKASEANAKRLGPGQTYLHFAVHGIVRDDRPWDSALVLAGGDGEDGWLKAGEVFGLDLRADLVVLSGCSTGLGKLTGDGVLGLARAFLYAGTPSIVVSQWDVSDVATAFVMDRFYAGLRATRSKAHALRAAQLAARARFPHPALWAAFVLVGEPK